MKNLKKLISVIIAVIMLVSSFATVAAADYADVESTNSYYKAIKVLSGLGIAQGDDEGNFNPTNDVKRSEMVAFVCRAMGEEDIATASSSNAFTDVAANHWAAGYIAWGVNRGIINGMGDGTFAPDASVTYQDAVVMIMRALGYDRIAQRAENGGYPTGYLKLASQYGVLKDAGYDNAKAATREIIAQLIYNALTAPLVDVSYYGVSVEDDRYVIYNGKSDNDLRTMLTYSNDVLKVKAEITKTPKANPTDCIDKAGNYMVELDIKDAYDYNVDDIVKEIGADPATVYVGETEAANLLGSTVEAYIAESEELNDWVLLAVVEDGKSVVSETVSKNFENLVDDTTANDVYVFEYYADVDDRKVTEIEIAKDAKIYYNGVEDTTVDTYEELKALLVEEASTITFMGNKNEAYSKVFVTKYQYAVVDSVNADELLIKFDATVTRGALDLDAESRGNEDFIYGIYDAEGKAMDIADIKAGDVLNMVAPKLDDGSVDATDDETDFVDIYVTSNVVEGKVAERKATGEYVIDGVEYESLVESLQISDEGVFYLTIDNKIIKKDATTSVTKNFAFLLGIEGESLFGKTTYTLRLFTADGVADYKVAESLKLVVGGASAVSYKQDSASNNQSELFYVPGESEDPDLAGSFTVAIADEATEAAAQAKVNDRFFAYKTNAAGEISEIRIAGDDGDPIAEINNANAKYVAEFDEFGGEAVGEAKFFVVPMEDKGTNKWNVDTDKMTLGTFSALDEDDGYDAYLYMLDGENELSAVLIAEKIGYGTEMAPLAVVKSIGTGMDEEENEVATYTFVQGGELVTLYADDEVEGDTLTVGDVFQYAVNAGNEIVEIKRVYDRETRALESYAASLDYEGDDVAFAFGIVVEYSDRIKLASDFDEDTGDAVAPAQFKFADVEGATYALIDETVAERNMVKVITANGVKETVKENAMYAAIVKVDANNKVTEIISIALNADFDSYAEVNASEIWKLNTTVED